MRKYITIQNFLVISAVVLFNLPVLAFNAMDGVAADSKVDSVAPPTVGTDAYPSVKSLGTINMGQVPSAPDAPTTNPVAMPPAAMASPMQPLPAAQGAPSAAMQPTAGDEALATPDISMKPMQAGNVSYITGGIGDEERDSLEAMKANYNLTVTSASNDGAFLGDVRISIRDPKGNELVNAPVGPIFLVKLPPGRYMLEASSHDKVLKRNVSVGTKEPSKVHFSWP